MEGGAEIDLAVLDGDLAGCDVYPVARLPRQRGVRFVFHTGHASRDALIALFPDAPTCIKPTSPERLIEQLAAVAPARIRPLKASSRPRPPVRP